MIREADRQPKCGRCGEPIKEGLYRNWSHINPSDWPHWAVPGDTGEVKVDQAHPTFYVPEHAQPAADRWRNRHGFRPVDWERRADIVLALRNRNPNGSYPMPAGFKEEVLRANQEGQL